MVASVGRHPGIRPRQVKSKGTLLAEKIKKAVVAVFLFLANCFQRIANWISSCHKSATLTTKQKAQIHNVVNRARAPSTDKGKEEAEDDPTMKGVISLAKGHVDSIVSITKKKVSSIAHSDGVKTLRENLNLIIDTTILPCVKPKLVKDYSWDKLKQLLRDIPPSYDELKTHLEDLDLYKHIKDEELRKGTPFLNCINTPDTDEILKEVYVLLHRIMISNFFAKLEELPSDTLEQMLEINIKNGTSTILERSFKVLETATEAKNNGPTPYQEVVDETIVRFKDYLISLRSNQVGPMPDSTAIATNILALLEKITKTKDLQSPIDLINIPENLKPIFEEGRAIFHKINCKELPAAIRKTLRSAFFKDYKSIIDQYIFPLVKLLEQEVDSKAVAIKMLSEQLEKAFESYSNKNSLTELLSETLLPQLEAQLICSLALNRVCNEKYAAQFLDTSLSLQEVCSQLCFEVENEVKHSKSFFGDQNAFFAIVSPKLVEIRDLVKENTATALDKQEAALAVIKEYFESDNNHIDPNFSLIVAEILNLADVKFRGLGGLANLVVTSESVKALLNKSLSDLIYPYRTSPNRIIDAAVKGSQEEDLEEKTKVILLNQTNIDNVSKLFYDRMEILINSTSGLYGTAASSIFYGTWPNYTVMATHIRNLFQRIIDKPIAMKKLLLQVTELFVDRINTIV